MNLDYRQYFIEKKRENGFSFTCLKDDAPDELQELIRSIHFDHFLVCLPNDWIYRTIHSAFEELALDPLENITIEADTYNTQLTGWLNENCNGFAHEYCNEFIQEFCPSVKGLDIINLIQGGQCLAIERIYNAVDDFIQEKKGAING